MELFEGILHWYVFDNFWASIAVPSHRVDLIERTVRASLRCGVLGMAYVTFILGLFPLCRVSLAGLIVGVIFIYISSRLLSTFLFYYGCYAHGNAFPFSPLYLLSVLFLYVFGRRFLASRAFHTFLFSVRLCAF
jgi:hypothetical protein